ncbi:uncharacterized protein F5891DRAFT_1193612 [Suillus fuscotomentosus]|uniref:KOW domain-containing protein n=1 Tax=Suillus fuscotomentosus TaxID=1912939 RepID=A0AAD4DYN3_9AGAM|nr:uncharacterized protein F5891DRAFT_1193612 [Suillus fuscotomentosus]KAG1895981.1 hypothetical protein F5891DRAFT_1193612 [Suillus fuscotomentosus]
MGTRSASAYMEDSLHVEKVSPGPPMFSLVDLERKFWVGDNVCVLDHSIVALALKGKNGIVVQIDEDTIVVHDQSSQCQFTVAIDSLATFIGDFTKKDSANVATVIETPMKGDHVIVTEGFYACEFGEVSEVDLRTQMLAFFSESQQLRITVPIRMTAFNPNLAALRHTPERGYDLVAGDIVQVVRGERLRASGKVLRVNLDNSTLMFEDTPHTEFTTRITYVARIGGKGDRDPMQYCIGKDVIIISGPMKSYRGTLHSLSRDECQVAVVQGSKREFQREHVVNRSGVLLTGVRLPYKLQMDFNKLVWSSFIRSPHVTTPRTPRHSPPPEASRSDPPTAATLQSWDAPAESVLLELNRQQDLSSASQDPWTINEADKEDLRLHPANASSSSSLADSLTSMFHDTRIAGLCCNWHMKLRVVKTSPATWFNNFMDRLVDMVAPDPFVLSNSLVKHGEIAVRYSSRTKNTGMKVDTIPLEFLAPEPPTGKSKKFTLIRGEFMGSVHTTMLAQRTAAHAPNRPVASFLFFGPTGVGKTELVKALAGFLSTTSREDLLISTCPNTMTDTISSLTNWSRSRFSSSLVCRLVDGSCSTQNVCGHPSTEARNWLVEKGYSDIDGTRTVARVMHTHVLLRGTIRNGDVVRITVSESDSLRTVTPPDSRIVLREGHD